MSSLDGSKSYFRGSDEVPVYQCDPCKDDGADKEAKHYCEDCEEYLCNPCKDYHMKFKATRSHKIASGRLFPKRVNITTISSCRVTCNCTRNRDVKIYCEDHADVICTDCQTLKHRKCKTCPLKDKLLSYEKNNFSLALKKANNLKSKIEQLKHRRDQDREQLAKLKNICLEEIQDCRKKISTVLDTAEEYVQEELNVNYNEQNREVEKDISTLNTTLQSVNTDIRLLEDANSNNTEEILFAADIKASKNIGEMNLLIQDLEGEITAPHLAFEENKKLMDLITNDISLGTIKGNKLKSKGLKKSMLDMRVEDKLEINMKLPEDTNEPSITGCIFIAEHVLVCDNNNQKLKLLDQTWKIIETLTLTDEPWNLAAADDQNVVVTFPTSSSLRCLQYIQVFPKLKIGKVIELDYDCAGIEVVCDEIYTTSLDDGKIWILDKTGRKKRNVHLTQNINESFYLSTRATENDTYVYVSDWRISSVICQHIDGTEVYHYQDQNLQRANGIYVDLDGNALVCDTDSNKVIIITEEGKKYRDLLTSANGLNVPICIAFRPDDNKLMIGGQTNANLLVFTLSQ